MKIIRWFLSHFFLILLIVAVIYGYMFWDNLAGKNTPAGKAIAYLSKEFVPVDKFVKAVKAKQAQLVVNQTPAKSQQLSPRVMGQHVVASNVPDRQSEKPVKKPPVAALTTNKPLVTTRNITQQPVSISYSHNQMRVTQNSVGQIKSQPEVSTKPKIPAKTQAVKTEVVTAGVEQKVQAAPVVRAAPVVDHRQMAKSERPAHVATTRAYAPDKFISAKVEQQLNNVDKNGKVINLVLKGDAIRDSWVTARKSFYQRRYKLSEQSYREVINNTTNNFDAYGELGNVYFNQGKNVEAAAAYFEAAAILVRTGQVKRGRGLMGLLKHLDSSKAADLQKLIDAATS